jgi:hypothetical protein
LQNAAFVRAILDLIYKSQSCISGIELAKQLKYAGLLALMPDCWLDAGLLARSQYSEVPATGHLDTGFSWFPCVYKHVLRWFP